MSTPMSVPDRDAAASGAGASRRVGLTGGIASGKSAVADLLAERGATIIDADVLAREVVAPATPGWAAVRERFGETVVAADGSLDRPALGRIVFGDEAARRDLEAIIHPAVRALAAERADAAEGLVVQVIPLLVETGQAEAFDCVVVVDVDPATQLARLQERDGCDEAAALARVGAQASREERLAVADVVIDNSGDRAALVAAVDRAWPKIVGGAA